MSRRNSQDGLAQQPLINNQGPNYGAAEVGQNNPEQICFTQKLKAFLVNHGGELAKFALSPIFAGFASVIYIQATKNGTLAQQISGPGINFLVSLQSAFKSADLILEKWSLGKTERLKLAGMILLSAVLAAPYGFMSLRLAVNESDAQKYSYALMNFLGSMMLNIMSLVSMGEMKQRVLSSLNCGVAENDGGFSDSKKAVIDRLKQLQRRVRFSRYRTEVSRLTDFRLTRDVNSLLDIAFVLENITEKVAEQPSSTLSNVIEKFSGSMISLALFVGAAVYSFYSGESYEEIFSWQRTLTMVLGFLSIAPQFILDADAGFGTAKKIRDALTDIAQYRRLPNDMKGFATILAFLIIGALAVPSGKTTEVLCDKSTPALVAGQCGFAGDTAVGFNFYFALLAVMTCVIFFKGKLGNPVDKHYNQILTALNGLIKQVEKIKTQEALATFKDTLNTNSQDLLGLSAPVVVASKGGLTRDALGQLNPSQPEGSEQGCLGRIAAFFSGSANDAERRRLLTEGLQTINGEKSVVRRHDETPGGFTPAQEYVRHSSSDSVNSFSP